MGRWCGVWGQAASHCTTVCGSRAGNRVSVSLKAKFKGPLPMYCGHSVQDQFHDIEGSREFEIEITCDTDSVPAAPKERPVWTPGSHLHHVWTRKNTSTSEPERRFQIIFQVSD